MRPPGLLGFLQPSRRCLSSALCRLVTSPLSPETRGWLTAGPQPQVQGGNIRHDLATFSAFSVHTLRTPPHPHPEPGLVHSRCLWDRWRGQEAARNTHVVEDREATKEGTQIEDKPPAADGEGARETAATTVAASPCTPGTPSPAPPRADLASQNFLVRQGRSWF